MARPMKEVLEYRRYELPLDFPILFLDGDNWRISDQTGYNLHFHNHLEIGICHEESGTMIFEGVPMEFGPGDLTVVPRHIPHTTYSAPGKASLWTYIFVDLGGLFSPIYHGAAEDFVVSGTTVDNFAYLLHPGEKQKLHAIVDCVIDELRGRKSNYQMAVRGLLLAFYFELQRSRGRHRQLGERPKGMLSIAPALECIYQNYSSRFTIEHLAELCHLSVTHFRKVFLSVMGDTPLDFLNTVRIEKACVLLQTTEKSILAISEQVGFSSYSSFNRYFDRVMGISPREYRNAVEWPDIKPNKKSILEYYGWL